MINTEQDFTDNDFCLDKIDEQEWDEFCEQVILTNLGRTPNATKQNSDYS